MTKALMLGLVAAILVGCAPDTQMQVWSVSSPIEITGDFVDTCFTRDHCYINGTHHSEHIYIITGQGKFCTVRRHYLYDDFVPPGGGVALNLSHFCLHKVFAHD